MTAAVDLRSLRDSAAALPLVSADIPAVLSHRGPVPGPGLPEVAVDHEFRAADGEFIRTYACRGGAVFAVVVLRLEARNLVLVSGPDGHELWNAVCAAMQAPRAGEVVDLRARPRTDAGLG